MELVQGNVLEVLQSSGRLKRTIPEQLGTHAWRHAEKMTIVLASPTKDPGHLVATQNNTNLMRLKGMVSTRMIIKS